MRLLKLTLGDIRFQFKYGFYFTYAVFCALYIFMLLLLPEAWRGKAASIMIYSDPAALGLFFMGALILLEKSQRVLDALAVSPVTVSEYMIAKVLSLMCVSVAVSVLIAIAAEHKNVGLVIVSTALTSSIFTLLGLIVAAGIKSLNQYVIMTLPFEIICFVPPLLYLFMPGSLLRFFPLSGSVALISNKSGNIFFDLFLLLIVNACLWALAYKAAARMWRKL